MELGAENRWRVFDSQSTSPVNSRTSRALRLTERRNEWQFFWGFRGGPVDLHGRKERQNRLSGGRFSSDLLIGALQYGTRKPW
jgi:hypothetical protein